jgi:copper chaperone CopZ
MMNAQTYPLTGLHCQACARRVTEALKNFDADVQVSLSPMQAVMRVGEATLAQLQAAVQSAGKYQIGMSDFKHNQPLPGKNTALNAINSVVSEEAPQSWLDTYKPLLLIVAFILGASILVQLGQHAGHGMGVSALSGHDTMRYFMAGFFLVFAFFKLLDLQAFADAYAGYDLLAARWRTWGLIYPFVELALGMAYLANFMPQFTAWLTLIVMGFSAIGVIRAVLDKRRIRCACLGTVFKLPMSTVTIVEDVGMVLMAAVMLVLPG